MAAVALINRSGFYQIKLLQSGILSQCLNVINYEQPHRMKHWNPKFKWLRSKKVIKFDLPNLQEKPNEVPPEEMKRRMKERGVMPPRPWIERPFGMSTTSGILEAYIPPEGDGKLSAFTTGGAKQKIQLLEKKSKSMLAIRKIRSFDEEFDPVQFAVAAQDIYIQSHEALIARDKYRLRTLVTERAYPEMMHNVRYTTIRWKFLKSLEPPRVVHARQTNLVSEQNLFAQITVRFHTQQTLAVYDRFGRLMHGSEILAKDVLEYVVFEKNISNEYGVWRLHHKIIPDWAEPKQPTLTTYRYIEEAEEPEEKKTSEISKEKAVESVQIQSGEKKTPPLETA